MCACAGVIFRITPSPWHMNPVRMLRRCAHGVHAHAHTWAGPAYNLQGMAQESLGPWPNRLLLLPVFEVAPGVNNRGIVNFSGISQFCHFIAISRFCAFSQISLFFSNSRSGGGESTIPRNSTNIWNLQQAPEIPDIVCGFPRHAALTAARMPFRANPCQIVHFRAFPWICPKLHISPVDGPGSHNSGPHILPVNSTYSSARRSTYYWNHQI